MKSSENWVNSVLDVVKDHLPYFLVGVGGAFRYSWITIQKRRRATEQLYTTRDLAIAEIPGLRKSIEELKDMIISLHDQIEGVQQEIRVMWSLTDTPMWRSLPTGECTFATPQLADLIGCDINDILHMGWLTYIHPDDRNLVRDEYVRALSEGRPYAQLFRYSSRECGVVHVLGKAVPTFNKEGKVTAYIGKATRISKEDYDRIRSEG